MKSIFRKPGDNERLMRFDGWRINSQLRVSLLEACGFHNMSLAKVAEKAEVDFNVLKRFTDGEDGLLGYAEMKHLLRVPGVIDDIQIVIGIENLDCNTPGPDCERTREEQNAYLHGLSFAWELYNKRG